MSEATVHVGSGKVRELFELDAERLLLVASDRISTFDVVLPTEIPDKGSVLTALSLWWFEQLADIVPNHLVAADVDDFPAELAPYADALRGRSVLCACCRPARNPTARRNLDAAPATV